VGLKEGTALLDVTLTDGNDDILLARRRAMAIRFNERTPATHGPLGRGRQGHRTRRGRSGDRRGRQSHDGDRTPTATCSHDSPTAQMRSPAAPSPRTATASAPPWTSTACSPRPGRSQSRGGKGRADIKTTERNGRSIAALGVYESDDVVVITKGGQLVRMPAASISQYGRGTQGVRVVSLNEGDGVTDDVMSVLMVTGLDKVFKFAPDTLTALAGLQLIDADAE
jgi:DNA gyrase subunit A